MKKPMKLGYLINSLEKLKSKLVEDDDREKDPRVQFDFSSIFPKEFHGDRGDPWSLALTYDDYCDHFEGLDPATPYKLSEFIDVCKNALEKESFEGWKGVDCYPTKDTLIFVNQKGMISETMVSGIRYDGYHSVYIVTGNFKTDDKESYTLIK